MVAVCELTCSLCALYPPTSKKGDPKTIRQRHRLPLTSHRRESTEYSTTLSEFIIEDI